MNYTPQYVAALIVAIGSGMIGAAIVAANQLGLSGQQVAILGIVNTGLVLAASFLPRVTRPPDPARTGQD